MPGKLIKPSPPAPLVTGPSNKSIIRPEQPPPQYLLDEAKATVREDFDASMHIAFQEPSSVITMGDIGLAGRGIAPTAVTEPFSLFSAAAIRQMRAEVFSDEVMKDCRYASNFNKHMVRGMDARRSPFTYAAWKSPEVIRAISHVAGISLVPSMDYEIAQINISASDSNNSNRIPDTSEKTGSQPLADGLSTVAWHYDSYPFVCVVMLSDCTGMIGGETAMRTGTGEIMKVRGPAMGTAVVLQGRYIEHQALKSLGGRERISMVTSFRPKSALVRDETVLTGVRWISDQSELYTQYTEYRLQILARRIRTKLKEERLREQMDKKFDVAEARAWLLSQRDFIDSMLCEVTQE